MNATEDLAGLRTLVVEQVMRLSDSDAAVLAFTTVAPRSTASRAALGRLLAVSPFGLDPTSPLAVWAAPPGTSPREVAADWRDRLPDRPASLYAELQRTEARTPHRCDVPDACTCPLYQRLLDARTRISRRNARRAG